MKIEDIKEGCYYINKKTPNYFRVVNMIVDSPSRPGGKVVSWSTDGFDVRLQRFPSDLRRGKSWGRCGIETFAKWADDFLDLDSQ